MAEHHRNECRLTRQYLVLLIRPVTGGVRRRDGATVRASSATDGVAYWLWATGSLQEDFFVFLFLCLKRRRRRRKRESLIQS